jgi:hypothetical protein
MTREIRARNKDEAEKQSDLPLTDVSRAPNLRVVNGESEKGEK